MADRVFVAKETFWYADENGELQLVHKDERFREGHPVTLSRDGLFSEDTSVREFEAVKKPVGRPPKTS